MTRGSDARITVDEAAQRPEFVGPGTVVWAASWHDEPQESRGLFAVNESVVVVVSESATETIDRDHFVRAVVRRADE